MKNSVPILSLKKHERLLLQEVYDRNLEGQIFTYNNVWMKLQKGLPNHFRLEQMDRRLISSDGEKIKILGVVALQRNRSIVKKIDAVVAAIWIIVQRDSKLGENVIILEVSELTGIPFKEVSLCIHLISDYGQYINSANVEDNTKMYRAVQFTDVNILYRYKEFPGTASLIKLDDMKKQAFEGEYFNDDEMLQLGWKIDEVINDLRIKLENGINELKAGQEIIWTDVRDDISELKPLMSKLTKKQWLQTFIGKLVMYGIEKTVFGPIVGKIQDFIGPTVKGLLN